MTLIVSQTLVTDTAFRNFQSSLDAGLVRLETIQTGSKPEQPVAAVREVLQECLGHGRARAFLYYTLPDPNALTGGSEILTRLLATLQAELNLPFKDRYAGRLGNFEVFQLASWLETDSPVLTEFVPENRKDLTGPRTLQICRTPAFAKQVHIAHLVCRTHHDVIVDRLIRLSPEVTRQAVPLPEAPDELELWIFEEDGEAPVFYEQSNFIRQVNAVMAVMGHSVVIQDELSSRAKQSGESAAKTIRTVTSISPQRSVIGGTPKGSWRAFSEGMQDFTRHYATDTGEDRWFPKGIEGEIGAIAHLNRLLNGGRIQRAVLVDPWFGSQSVARLLVRLSSRNLDLTIITSWTTENPDTNERVESRDDATAELEAALNNVRHLLNPSVTVSNLVDGQDHAFHDRYLLIYPHDGRVQAYLLSNSINKMAGKWPFAMSLLTPVVSRQVQHYIEGLCRGEDTARRRPLEETFRWPAHEK
jgi:hypothetical protein